MARKLNQTKNNPLDLDCEERNKDWNREDIDWSVSEFVKDIQCRKTCYWDIILLYRRQKILYS
jgi:hypothetical protein